jgi:hypothetical protein
MEIVHIFFLNYHLIVNVFSKLLIGSMYPPGLPNNVNIPHNDKNILHKIIKNLKQKKTKIIIFK